MNRENNALPYNKEYNTPQAAQANVENCALKLDCSFHAMHSNDIGTLCIMMTSATFKSLYGNATKRLKLPQIRKKNEK